MPRQPLNQYLINQATARRVETPREFNGLRPYYSKIQGTAEPL